VEGKINDQNEINLWLPKVIAVSSKFQYYDYFDAILEDLYNRSCSDEIE
jgi:hypothetical protein